VRVHIDVDAYRRNLAVLLTRLGPADVMAVVKDDAYGHGLKNIVPAALDSGIRKFGVLDIPTGLAVRQLAGTREAQLFAWLFDSSADFSSAVDARIDLGVSSVAVLDAVASSASHDVARVHLKIDSGLHRNGASPERWGELVKRALHWQSQGRVRVVGVWTHIGEASDAEDDRSRAIFDNAFNLAVDAGLAIEQRHLAASAASFARSEFRYDFARVGGFTYGVAPGDGIGPAQIGLEPVMSATANIVAVDGTTVQVDAGYLDGIPDWVLGDGQPSSWPVPGFDVSLHGVRCPILKVDAQTLTIDVSALPEPARVGETAVLFGSHLRGEPVLQEWADAIGTVGEEIVVRVGRANVRD
jgi:alanine racemase